MLSPHLCGNHTAAPLFCPVKLNVCNSYDISGADVVIDMVVRQYVLQGNMINEEGVLNVNGG